LIYLHVLQWEYYDVNVIFLRNTLCCSMKEATDVMLVMSELYVQ